MQGACTPPAHCVRGCLGSCIGRCSTRTRTLTPAKRAEWWCGRWPCARNPPVSASSVSARLGATVVSTRRRTAAAGLPACIAAQQPRRLSAQRFLLSSICVSGGGVGGWGDLGANFNRRRAATAALMLPRGRTWGEAAGGSWTRSDGFSTACCTCAARSSDGQGAAGSAATRACTCRFARNAHQAPIPWPSACC